MCDGRTRGSAPTRVPLSEPIRAAVRRGRPTCRPPQARVLHTLLDMIEQPSKPTIPRPPDPIDKPPPDIKPVPPPDIPPPAGPPDIQPPTFPERGNPPEAI